MDRSLNNCRILMLHGSSDLYGASKMFLLSIKSLQSKGAEVIVVLSEYGPLVDELNLLQVDLHIYKLGIIRRKYFNAKGLLNRLLTIRRAKAYLSKMVSEKKIDLIYSNTSAVLVGGWVAKKMKIPHVTHLHEIIKSPNWLRKFLGKMINYTSSKVLAVSQAVKENWGDVIAVEKIELVYNGIDQSKYLQSGNQLRNELSKPTDSTILIGMVARVNQWKGQNYFLDIAKILSHEHDNLHFVIAGDAYPGTEYLVDELILALRKSGIENQITYLGYRSDVEAILSGLDIFVLPSILPDPLPTTVLEAMASAKPVIATSHGGAKEMVLDGETGFLIPWDNAKKAASILSILINNPQKRVAMGKAGRDRVLEHFSIQAYLENFSYAIYKTLVK
ncbi:glycosyltransferase family 4 protein [Belliella sp. DSM 107340]|uniref:Glycosyltransferase family 4 protein n=1 Tax=Belliella calami TaxID=2923436 RepID=A0ABS9UM83_9BACT|nr:glycosyltransferase family 4 protein [Belliella calami]MCH7397730.1 glycosyltransferase family 4 protein [Belliella calami]